LPPAELMAPLSWLSVFVSAFPIVTVFCMEISRLLDHELPD